MTGISVKLNISIYRELRRKKMELGIPISQFIRSGIKWGISNINSLGSKCFEHRNNNGMICIYVETSPHFKRKIKQIIRKRRYCSIREFVQICMNEYLKNIEYIPRPTITEVKF